MDLEHQIHYLETEAYTSVLKAFIAQSDLLTWVNYYHALLVWFILNVLLSMPFFAEGIC